MSNEQIILWDVTKKAEVFAITGHTGMLQEAAFSSDGRHFITISNDQIRLWKSTSRIAISTTPCHKDFKRLFAVFSPNGQFLVTHANLRTKIQNVLTQTEPFTLKGLGTVTQPPTFSPDGQFLAIKAIGLTSIWNTATGNEIFRTHESTYFSPDSQLLIAHSHDLIRALRLKSTLNFKQQALAICLLSYRAKKYGCARLCPALITLYNSLPKEYKNLLWHEINYDDLQYTSPTDDLVSLDSKKRKQPDE